ncbi:tetratricopeptide repeat protein [Thiomicrorhabdus sp. ZW0627]|uniref:tetratricopeptide repeat protein n=1 Tax=Thiomicrorhabdus sp. ZW0627 TaxID=3039774 RepID=UPI002436BAEC|nr:tetratricopeptide repeat protein [Thiomicrorhabdus sp. ZW0627]MDG6774750.1 tetratricopeptide repeat protein [Thiomicrorhabdus sp. ZW0627]
MSSKESYIFEVSQSNFNNLVLMNSYKLPVVVEFMSVNSEVCINMETSLSELAREFAGQFVFAKLDVYEQPELKEQYQIENLPTIKVFKDGEVVRNEIGKMDSNELAAMLKDFGIYRESDEMRLQARELHLQGDTGGAVNLLTQAIQADPSNTKVAMDMVQVLLDVNVLDQAMDIFNRLPDKDKESETGRALIGQLTFKQLASETEGKQAMLNRLDQNPLDFDAYFDLAVCLVAEHDYQGALESLFALFEQEPNYKDGAAREMIVTILNMLSPSDPELSKQYRQRLGSALS